MIAGQRISVWSRRVEIRPELPGRYADELGTHLLLVQYLPWTQLEPSLNA